MLLTSLAWGLATSPSFGAIVRLALSFVFVHFLLLSLMTSTAAYFLVGRLLGPGVAGLPGRRRQGLFEPVGGVEQLEFGYCFDVSVTSRRLSTISCPLRRLMAVTIQVAIRAFFPVWVFIYVAQFILLPLVSRDYWYLTRLQSRP